MSIEHELKCCSFFGCCAKCTTPFVIRLYFVKLMLFATLCVFVVVLSLYKRFNCSLDFFFGSNCQMLWIQRTMSLFLIYFPEMFMFVIFFNHFPFIIFFHLFASISSVQHKNPLSHLSSISHHSRSACSNFRIIIGTHCRRVGNIIHFLSIHCYYVVRLPLIIG